MSLEQIAKSIDITFLALLDQLLEVGYFITPLEKIDMKTDLYFQPLPIEQELLKGMCTMS